MKAAIGVVGSAVGGEVVDEHLSLFGIDGIFALVGHGLGVAVGAFQVAALGHVPDHHRLLVGGELEQMGRQLAGVAAVTQGVRGFHLAAVKLGNTDHKILMRGRFKTFPAKRNSCFFREMVSGLAEAEGEAA